MTLERSPTEQAAGKVSCSLDTVQALRHASGRGRLAEWQLRRLGEAIESSAAPWSIEAMAALIGLSPGRFCKRFRATTGVPPHRWQMLQRLERAKRLLCDPSLTLTDIAYACGYASSAHFSTSFGRATGTTPSQYRRQCTAHAR
ncbi:helix-turn-helix transcriptional regulator [Bradyrhizobium liaoningense]|uniref:helix-turn-helix transcriptional regulator n=1 Tax=Bradyrhizobium liaoningense TaxID=43992 RepID=UPI001BA488D0|nr:helix-turn-helix transcriptional regulator [Bradyrhizobium liaoningense]MBR0845768.1 helix-turn-helix transcriptional regulator [Bradyrhizobium liaoningense]MBR0859932.1 helix-turn-helix transcriptional regulator [Bradyrhizobium liaoningense]